MNHAALEAALKNALQGEVRFDAGARAAYASDASNYRQVPIGVVLPRSADDIVAAVAACREARGWKPGRIGARALVHGHCHQKALGGMRADLALLSVAGIEADAPDTGCCGMAGSFGYRPETYEASVKIANLSLLPKVNQTPPETLIVANGFSCREQIEGLSGRGTLHIAEVLARTLG